MGKQTCPSGHTWKTKFQASPRELFCRECGERALPSLRAKSSGPGLRAEAESPTLAEAHARFTQLVCEWPCWARENRPGHKCWGDIDPHHLVPASWIRQTYGTLPSELLAAILYAPILGAPVCRAFHEALENRSEVIAWHELDDELKVFAHRVDESYPGLPSFMARLELESPKRKAAA